MAGFLREWNLERGNSQRKGFGVELPLNIPDSLDIDARGWGVAFIQTAPFLCYVSNTHSQGLAPSLAFSQTQGRTVSQLIPIRTF